MPRNKVFLDSSVLITALLSSRGGSFYVLTQLKDGYRFQINNFVLEEIFTVLDRKFPNQRNLKNSLFLLIGLAKIEILPNPPNSLINKSIKIINKEDAVILASAILNSHYFLTLDKDFLNEKVKNFARENKLSILTPKELINLWRKEKTG